MAANARFFQATPGAGLVLPSDHKLVNQASPSSAATDIINQMMQSLSMIPLETTIYSGDRYLMHRVPV